ncbi:MAG: DUF167 domain-containing protein [Candidatus Paceibacterota bacterium]|jgi:hypothetical protein
MKIFVKAKPLAKEEKIEKVSVPAEVLVKAGEAYFVIWVKEPPKQGKANEAIIRKLAEYFQVPVSQVILKSGFSSKNKVFEIK